ncbi:MAG: hypothetical protein V1796_00955, partial [Pseudomonadota bacterium]
ATGVQRLEEDLRALLKAGNLDLDRLLAKNGSRGGDDDDEGSGSSPAGNAPPAPQTPPASPAPGTPGLMGSAHLYMMSLNSVRGALPPMPQVGTPILSAPFRF